MPKLTLMYRFFFRFPETNFYGFACASTLSEICEQIDEYDSPDLAELAEVPETCPLSFGCNLVSIENDDDEDYLTEEGFTPSETFNNVFNDPEYLEWFKPDWDSWLGGEETRMRRN